jgi:hypothetical protein
MDELFLRWIQKSRFCSEAKMRVVSSKDQGHDTANAHTTGEALSDGCPHGIATDDHRCAYIVASNYAKLMVKTARALSDEEYDGLAARLKVQCPSSWQLYCSGHLPDGSMWSSEHYVE